MQKKSLKLNESRIGKDEDGFEDVDQFWDAADTNTTFRSSNTTSRLSDAGDSLNYDDTGSISGWFRALGTVPSRRPPC